MTTELEYSKEEWYKICVDNSIELAKYMCDQNIGIDELFKNPEYYFELSFTCRSYDVAKFIHSITNIEIIYDNCCSYIVSGTDTDLDIVKWLVESGMDIQKHGQNILGRACMSGNLLFAKYLHESGVDIANIRSDHFAHAILLGHDEMVKWICDIGYDIRKDNDIAFRYACLYGRSELVAMFYDLGADINAGGDNSFQCACSGGHMEIAKWLYELGTDINANNSNAFLNVIVNRHYHMMQWMHEIGAEKNELVQNAMNKEFVNCCLGNDIINAKLLYEIGADVMCDNCIAIIHACNKNNLEFIKWLLYVGVNIESRLDEIAKIILINNNCEIINWFVENGYLINNN